MVNNKFTIESEESTEFYNNLNDMNEQLEIIDEELNAKDDIIAQLKSQLLNLNQQSNE